MKRKVNLSYTRFILGLLLLFVYSLPCEAQSRERNVLTGFRASRILSSYPYDKFPAPGYWTHVAGEMSRRFAGGSGAGVWIVSLFGKGGTTLLSFPGDELQYNRIKFAARDENEEYLSRFDSMGVHVWLQVEPGGADVETLIQLTLNRYKHHPCVIGFGVDVEWYHTQEYRGGKPVSDEAARRWEAEVKKIDPNYSLFLKHYSDAWMPPVYRGDILFIDDSQRHGSMPSLISEFTRWGKKFEPNPVGFQIGYADDYEWWALLNDPPKSIGKALLDAVPNCIGLFWVDFTITEIFPVTDENGLPVSARFNRGYQDFAFTVTSPTEISFTLPKPERVELSLYDDVGMEILPIIEEELEDGEYSFELDLSNISAAAGLYYYHLRIGSGAEITKPIYIQ